MTERRAILLGLMLAGALMALRPVRSPDVWHHVKSGWLVAQQGPAAHDVFSCTAQGKRWIQYEWLAQWVIYQVWTLGGVAGLIALRAAAMAVVAWLLLRACEGTGHAGPAPSLANGCVSNVGPAPSSALHAMMVALALLALAGRLFTRPELFTWGIFAAWLCAGEMLRIRNPRPANRNRVWLILAFPALMALWVNLHGAWPAGLAWLGLVCAGETVRWLFARRKAAANDGAQEEVILCPHFPAALWAAMGLALAATLANPYGGRIWEVPFALTRTPEVARSIAEWKPVVAWQGRLLVDWAHLLDPRHFGAWIFLAVALVRVRRLSLTDWLVLGFFGVLSLTARRHIALAMLATAPIIARHLAAMFCAVSENLERRSPRLRASVVSPRLRPCLLALLICAVTVWVSFGWKFQRAGVGLATKTYPIGAAEFLRANRLDGNLFNSYMFGNYLLYARYPQNRVFIDGRVDMYGGEVVRLYDQVREASDGWREALARYDAQIAVLDTTRTTERGLLLAMHEAPDWALVWWDDISAVYVQRTPEREAFLANAYIYAVRPDDYDPAIPAGRAEADYLHKLAEDPDCVRALYGLAQVRARYGDRRMEEPLRLLQRAASLEPRNSTVRYALGSTLLTAGRLEDAERELNATLRLGEHAAQARMALSVIAHKRGDLPGAIAHAQKARALEPNNWMIHSNLSLLHEQAGDIDAAIAEAKEVLRLRRGHPAAQRRLDELRARRPAPGS